MQGAWRVVSTPSAVETPPVALGFLIPFSDEQSTEGWLSARVSYELCKWSIPLVEVKWFHVLDPGDGTGNYPGQVGGAVPAEILK